MVISLVTPIACRDVLTTLINPRVSRLSLCRAIIRFVATKNHLSGMRKSAWNLNVKPESTSKRIHGASPAVTSRNNVTCCTIFFNIPQYIGTRAAGGFKARRGQG